MLKESSEAHSRCGTQVCDGPEPRELFPQEHIGCFRRGK